MTDEEEFWKQAAAKGLPWFRWFRRSIPIQQIDQEMEGTKREEAWNCLKAKMEPTDKIWPFKFHIRSCLGMRSGYVVLRKGKPIGGVVLLLS